MSTRALALWLVGAGVLFVGAPAEAKSGFVWGAHAYGIAELGGYFFAAEEVGVPDPEPVSFDFGFGALGGGFDLEAGGWLSDLALVGYLRAGLNRTGVFGDGPRYSGIDGNLGASLGLRVYRGLEDGGFYLVGDLGPEVRAQMGGQDDVGAPDNVFDFDPLYGARIAGGLGWRSEGGFDLRAVLSVTPLFNDQARVVPFGLELHIGYGTP